MSVVSTLRRIMQEDREFEASIGYIRRFTLKKSDKEITEKRKLNYFTISKHSRIHKIS
jgi:hypothetical protein